MRDTDYLPFDVTPRMRCVGTLQQELQETASVGGSGMRVQTTISDPERLLGHMMIARDIIPDPRAWRPIISSASWRWRRK
jgi:hypothetical protein